MSPRHLALRSLALAAALAIWACETGGSGSPARSASSIETESINQLEMRGQIFVLDVDPRELAKILEDAGGISMIDAVPVLAAAHIDQIDTVYKEKAVVTVLQGPLPVGSNVVIKHEMKLIGRSGDGVWRYSFAVGPDTNTTPMVIITGFRIKLPANIEFTAYANAKPVASRRITAD